MKLLKTIALLLIFPLIIPGLCGCVELVSRFYPDDTTDAESTDQITVGDEYHFKDFDGNMLYVPKAPQKIICVSPVATEILYGLGCSKRVVALDSYSAQIEGAPVNVISFKPIETTAEQLRQYNADILFYSAFYISQGIIEELRSNGMTVVRIPDTGSIASAEANIRFIGNLLSLDKNAEKLISEMRDEIDTVRNAAIFMKTDVSIYIEYANGSACGGNLIVSELCEIAGAQNIYGDREGIISVTNAETLALNPGIIISICDIKSYSATDIRKREGWDKIKAIRAGDVYHIDSISSVRPTQNITKALKEIAVAVGTLKADK